MSPLALPPLRCLEEGTLLPWDGVQAICLDVKSVTECKLTLLTAMNLREKVWRQGIRLYLESWLTKKMADRSQNNHSVRVWMPGSFMDQRWRR